MGARGSTRARATFGDGAGNAFLGLESLSVFADEREACIPYTTLAKARTKSITASETREGEATILGERASSEVSPAEALALVLVTLVRRSTRTGVVFVGSPVLKRSELECISKMTGCKLRHTDPVAWPEARRERNAIAEVTFIVEG